MQTVDDLVDKSAKMYLAEEFASELLRSLLGGFGFGGEVGFVLLAVGLLGALGDANLPLLCILFLDRGEIDC